jgi:hypothetical protein
MDECGPEQEGQRHGQAKEKGENQRINVQQRQKIPEYLGRESARKRKMSQMRKQVFDGRREKKVQNML